MADHFRCLVSWGATTDPPRDRCSNTLYFENDATVPITDYDALANDVHAAYSLLSWLAGADLDVRFYNMQDPEPRPIRGEKRATVAGSWNNRGPREVSVCLSFFGERNLPSTRGRSYHGPFPGTITNSTRPGSGIATPLLDLADDLSEVGGGNIHWVVYSPKTGDYHYVKNAWVNDEWDTMRSRQLRESTRWTRSISE